jgi:small subunit ribosomal protein S7
MNPQIVVDNAVANASPAVMIKSKRVGWSVYQVPVEVKPGRRLFFACKWILDAARAKSWRPMWLCLADEMLASYAEQGYAVKKKEDSHKMAEANKAYAYMAKYIN